MKKFAASMMLIFATAFVCHANDTKRPLPSRANYCWEDISAGLDVEVGSNENFEARIDPGGNLWIGLINRSGIHIFRRVGARWKNIPGPRRTGHIGGPLSIAPSPGNGLTVAWAENFDSQSKVVVAALKDGQWKKVGEPLSAIEEDFTNSGHHVITYDRHGKLVALWSESHRSGGGGGPHSLYAASFENGKWSMLGGPLAVKTMRSGPFNKVAITAGEDLYAAWVESDKTQPIDDGGIRMAKWNGGAWEDAHGASGPMIFPGNRVWNLQLGLSPTGTPMLAWIDFHMNLNGKTRYAELLIFELIDRQLRPRLMPLPSVSSTPSKRNATMAFDSVGALLVGWTEMGESGISHAFVSRIKDDKQEEIFYRYHLDSGKSHVSQTKIIATGDRGFYLLFTEGESGKIKLRVVKAYPCPEGKIPAQPAAVSSIFDFWPKTVDEAVDKLLEKWDEKSKNTMRSTPFEDLIQYHMGLGMGIRNSFGLWGGNEVLRESCGDKTIHPDDCSQKIIEALWRRLQKKK